MKIAVRFNQTLLFILIFFIFFTAKHTNAQEFRWLSAGSLHNFYADIGCEREEVRPGSNQQDGLGQVHLSAI